MQVDNLQVEHALRNAAIASDVFDLDGASSLAYACSDDITLAAAKECLLAVGCDNVGAIAPEDVYRTFVRAAAEASTRAVLISIRNSLGLSRDNGDAA